VSFNSWDDWLRLAGRRLAPTQKGWVFDDPGMMLEAVLRGLGVGLVPFPLLNDLLASGRLVRLFGDGLRQESAYFARLARRGGNKRAAKLLMNWIVSRAGGGM
jgi:LysR family glycine cleavage system transcriptional activator